MSSTPTSNLCPTFCVYCGEEGHFDGKTMKAHEPCTSLDWKVVPA